MALFGRDSLLASYMALPLDSSLALGTLRALARRQGRTVDPGTEEEPGRILHETRLGLDFPLARGGGSVYYGTADATPLFVSLLGELHRWGLVDEHVRALLPNADRALEWIDRYGDRDGDGFVEYQRASEAGLANQGWKDSHDGVTFADGTIPRTPIALCEVQGYVYTAFLARAHLASETGDREGCGSWAARAAALKRAFNDRFWLPERGYFALGLDADKRPIDALASNMGHCLWSGIVDEDKAPAGRGPPAVSADVHRMGGSHVGDVDGRVQPGELPQRVGLAARQRPHRHRPHALRLRRAGAAAWRPASSTPPGRSRAGCPELFCGFDRDEYPAPLPYPTSCSPQAWAAAAPLQLLRALLRVDPSMSHRQVWFDPAWPSRYGPITVRNLLLGERRATLEVDGSRAQLTGLPDDVEVVSAPRPPLSALLPPAP